MSGATGLMRTPIVGTQDYGTKPSMWPVTKPMPKRDGQYLVRDRLTEKTDRHANRQTARKPDSQQERQTNKQTDRQLESHLENRQTCRQAEKNECRCIQKDSQKKKQTNTPTRSQSGNKQVNTQT